MSAPVSLGIVSRRRLLQGAGAIALATVLPRAAAQSMPAIPALATLLAGRTPRWERLRMELPALADNGQAVPLRLSMSGPLAPESSVLAIHLFSEVNPVPDMAVFEFPSPPTKVEIDTRVRARELDARAQRVQGQRTLLRMRAERRQRQQNQRCLQQHAW